MKIKLDQRTNPQTPEAPGKWYPVPLSGDKVSTEELNKEITERTTVSSADADAVFEIFGEVLPERLKRGDHVYVRHVGTFRLGLHGVGVDNPNDFKIANILGNHVIFTPDARFLQKLRDIHYEDSGIRGSESLDINWLTDVTSGTSNERLTPGGSVRLSGHQMQIGGEDPSIGLKLINVATQEVVTVPMTSIPLNKPKEIIFVVPAGLTSGQWQVRIVTQVSAGKVLKSPRGFTYEAILVV